ncbi:hypothetical protein D3C78_1821460 [compost metagenome]
MKVGLGRPMMRPTSSRPSSATSSERLVRAWTDASMIRPIISTEAGGSGSCVVIVCVLRFFLFYPDRAGRER